MTLQQQCRFCKKKLDLENGAYFRRQVAYDDAYEELEKPYLLYTCSDCIIVKEGNFA